MNTTDNIIGVIGGSGIYDIDGLSNTYWKKISSPFGQPSDELLFGELNNKLVSVGRYKYFTTYTELSKFLKEKGKDTHPDLIAFPLKKIERK